MRLNDYQFAFVTYASIYTNHTMDADSFSCSIYLANVLFSAYNNIKTRFIPVKSANHFTLLLNKNIIKL